MGFFGSEKVSKKKFDELAAENRGLQKQADLLAEQNRDLKQENLSLVSENAELRLTLQNKQNYSERYREKDRQKEEKRSKFDEYYIQNLTKFYVPKESAFSNSEQQVFWSLNNNIFAKSDDVFVFPHVRLADFTEALRKKEFDDYFGTVIHNITSTHVDFLICRIVRNGKHSKYIPQLAIEVNGREHTTNETRIWYDNVKREILNAIGLPLLCIENSEIENSRSLTREFIPKLKEKLRQYFRFKD